MSKSIEFGGVLFAAAVILSGIFLAPVWDAPPVEDADMRIVREVLPEERNAFPLLLEAAAALEASVPDRDTWWMWINAPEEHADAVSDWAGSVTEIRARLQEALDIGRAQTPEAPQYSDDLSWVSPLRQLGTYLSLLSRTASEETRRRKRVEDHLRFADLLHGSGESLKEALTAIGIYRIAAQNLMDDLYADKFSPESTARILQTLLEVFPDPERMVLAFQSEYRAAVFLLTEELPVYGFGRISLEGKPDQGFFTLLLHRPHTWTFQPNRTRRMILDARRKDVAVLRGEIDVRHLPDDIPPARFLPDRSFRSWLHFSHNGVGKLFFFMTEPARKSLITPHRNGETQLQALRLIAALRLFHHHHGRLPDTLQALVPEFLEEVPADPYDGKPFRYLPESARIYSVGPNCLDQGGSTKLRGRNPGPFHTEDLVFGIFEAVNPEP